MTGDQGAGPQLVEIEARDDPRVSDYIALRDVNLRRSLEGERGLFIAEGDKVIRRAVLAGYRPRSFLLAPRWLDSLADVLALARDVPVYLVSEALAEQITGFHVHRGALAALHRSVPRDPEAVLTGRRVVVCEDIVDHANVGAILRCAAGLGWDGALLSPRCADPLYRRAVKVGMGAVFSLPWARLPDWDEALPTLSAHGFLIVGMALAERAVPLEEVADELRREPATKVAMLVGTEGEGLSSRWLQQADRLARIPMYAGIDSLNVAAATAVACYALGPGRR